MKKQKNLQKKIIYYFEETSAKNGTNTKEAFNMAAKILFKEHLKYKNRAQNISFSDNYSESSYNTIPAKLVKVNTKRSSNCC